MMKSETQSITVSIDKKEALSIYNALLKSVGNMEQPTPENTGAINLRDLLQANFFSQITGVHKL